jgi:hypothetical protein
MHKALKISVTLLVAVAMLGAIWLLAFGAAWAIDHVGLYTFCWLGLGIAAGVCSWREREEAATAARRAVVAPYAAAWMGGP